VPHVSTLSPKACHVPARVPVTSTAPLAPGRNPPVRSQPGPPASGRNDLPETLAEPGWARIADQLIALFAKAAFGGQNRCLAVRLELGSQCFAEHPLRGPEAVGLGGVEELIPRSRALRIAALPSSTGTAPSRRRMIMCQTPAGRRAGWCVRVECSP
jgi:hypothetical protein